MSELSLLSRSTQSVSYLKSLKGKGLMFLIALFLYSLFLAAYVLSQKGVLLDKLNRLEEIQRVESALVEADLAAFSAVTELFMIVDPVGRDEILARVHQHFGVLQQKYQRLEELFPNRAPSFKSMLRQLADTLNAPTPNNLAKLRGRLQTNKVELDLLLSQNRALRQEAMSEYLAHSDKVALLAFLLGISGLLLVGVVVGVFFGRLTKDLLALQSRVGQIVKGYRGQPLENNRVDELGVLTQGVNDMAHELSEREKELEIERRKHFHQEKMGAIGHLAAGVVHEIGNPVAAILGLTRELQESLGESPEETGQDRELLVGNLEFIYGYADRLRLIAEDLANFNRPQHNAYEWLDLNEVIESVWNLLRYDERWYGISLERDLDPQLPAIKGVSDQLSQVVMNLLVNAFEAMEGVEGRAHQVYIQTRMQDAGVLLVVKDNGCGIPKANLGRVFDAFYSTKSGQQSAGLGLLLCYSIVGTHGGTIRLSSQEGQGTEVNVLLPLESRVVEACDSAVGELL